MRFGRLNVVEPSPDPYVSPIMEYSVAYVSRLTAEPSHNSQPSGRVFAEKAATTPKSSPSGCTEPFVLGCFPCVDKWFHGQSRRLYGGTVAVDGRTVRSIKSNSTVYWAGTHNIPLTIICGLSSSKSTRSTSCGCSNGPYNVR